MDVVVARCAGLDVHKDTVVACVRTPGPDGDRVSETRTFGTMTVELLTLRDWLVAHGVTLVGMESTGVFWRPVFYTLEDAMECWLLNAQHMRNVPGRKSDVADAGWIAQLVEHGLVRPSFVPPPPIRELRELTRYRKTQIEERTRGGAAAGQELAGRRAEALQRRQQHPGQVRPGHARRAGRRDPRRRGPRRAGSGAAAARNPGVDRALTGRFGPTHALVVGDILAHLDYLDEAIGRVSARVDEVIRPFVAERELLTTIPGVDKRLAEAIIAEIGVDMTRFGAAARLASWAGMCPGQHESAGTSRSGRARHGDTHLQKHLAVAAMAAARTRHLPGRAVRPARRASRQGPRSQGRRTLHPRRRLPHPRGRRALRRTRR